MKILFCTIIISLFSGCFTQRAAQGLSENEVNISSSLTLNTIRYGITNNVEARVSEFGFYKNEQHYSYDIYIHSHSDSNAINYGLLLGHTMSPVFKPAFYSGAIVSKSISDLFTPYISFIFPFNNSLHGGEGTFTNYLAIGSELTISLNKNKTFKLHIVPEADYYFIKGVGDIGDPSWATISVGLSIDFNKIFAP